MPSKDVRSPEERIAEQLSLALLGVERDVLLAAIMVYGADREAKRDAHASLSRIRWMLGYED